MTVPQESLADLRVGDLITFLAVRRSGSITAAARELKVTPSQVSKAISRLEEHIHMKLLSRSSRGVSLSESGRRIVPHVESALARLRLMRRTDSSSALELTVAAPSYLIHLFLPTIAACQPQLRVRGLELPPALVRAYAAENFFDLTFLPSGTERLPAAWSAEAVGDIRKGLFGTPAMAKRLGAAVTADRLAKIPFVCPIYNTEGKFVAVDDDCPLSHADRQLGHEAQTIGLALELAARTDQLVFGPAIAARRYVTAGALQEIRVSGWNVSEPLYVACNGDRVLARVQNAIVKALREALSDLDTP